MTTTQAAAPAFRNLFSPLTVGGTTIRNRILSTAHYTGYGEGGLPSAEHRDYWASKAKGGIGLIVTEVQPVHPSAGISPKMIHCWRDEVVDAWKPVVEAVHEHGAKIIAQLWHPGRQGGGSEQYPSWAPSAIPNPANGVTPHAMTTDEVREVIAAFGTAARNMKAGGLDGVEIHGAHGYMVEQFLSPLTNQRTDEYGGSLESRLRFAQEVIDTVREAVGPGYTVGIRISGDQFQTGGLNLEDMKTITRALTADGKLDYVNVSFSGAAGAVIAPMYVPAGQFVYLAAGIKEATDLPVFCIGRINDPVLAESIVANHQADVVGMTRANICDPELPNKAREGRVDDIRRCIACNEGCWGHVSNQLPITCAINPSVGREEATVIEPAAVKRKVMVIGGGIAGMEAARVAAMRGHQVSLYEKEPYLGGQLQIAARAPGRQDFAEPVRWYENQFRKLGVEVHLGTAVDSAEVSRAAPGAVILATGGVPSVPDIPGVDLPHVVQARDVLMERVDPGETCVVFAADQGMEGLTTADFLASRGRKVHLVVPQMAPAGKVEPITTMMVMARLARQGVNVLTMTRVSEIAPGSVTLANVFGAAGLRLDGIDTVVLANGSRANDGLAAMLRERVGEVILAGECLAPRKLEHSTLDGLKAGLAV